MGRNVVICHLWCFVLLVCGRVWGESPILTNDDDAVYTKLTYTEITEAFEGLAEKYPKLVKLESAEERYGKYNVKTSQWKCDDLPCDIMIVRLGNNETLTAKTPEVYVSGALHGNERLGPPVCTYLAEFLCERYGKNDKVTWLMDNRVLWMTPMTNPIGVANDQREENNIDPNRDFPYRAPPDACMATMTARAVNELYREHLFRLGITFHGGQRVMAYEWGSFDHLERDPSAPSGYSSTEPPDEQTQVAIGKAMQAAAGREKNGDFWYPLGAMTDLVYAVDGGMEDWSYAASWKPSGDPITVCDPSANGGYDKERTKYNEHMVRCLLFLFEMDKSKHPEESTYGNRAEVVKASATDGHIARNMRSVLKLMELVDPYVVFTQLPPKEVQPNDPASIALLPIGCVKATSLRLRMVKAPCHELTEGAFMGEGSDVIDLSSTGGTSNAQRSGEQGSTGGTGGAADEAALWQLAATEEETDCRGLGVWEEEGDKGEVVFEFTLPQQLQAGQYCAAVLAEFDQGWAKQEEPDPPLKPQAHISQARLYDNYTAENAGIIIEGHKTWLFPRGTASELAIPSVPGNKVVYGFSLTVSFLSSRAIMAVSSVALPLIGTPLSAAEQGNPVDLFTVTFNLRNESRVSDEPLADTGGAAKGHDAVDILIASVRPVEQVSQGLYVLRVREYGDLLKPGNTFEAGDAKLEEGVLASFQVGEPKSRAKPLENAHVVFETRHKIDASLGDLVGRGLALERYASLEEQEYLGEGHAVVPLPMSPSASSDTDTNSTQSAVVFSDLYPTANTPPADASSLICYMRDTSHQLVVTRAKDLSPFRGYLVYRDASKESGSAGSGQVHVDGALCGIDSGKGAEMTVRSASGCCKAVEVQRPLPTVTNPTLDRVIPVKARFDPKDCHCGPGDQLTLNHAKTLYTCTLGYRDPESDTSHLTSTVCPVEALAPPSYREFNWWQQLVVFLIFVVASACLITPCVLWRYKNAGERKATYQSYRLSGESPGPTIELPPLDKRVPKDLRTYVDKSSEPNELHTVGIQRESHDAAQPRAETRAAPGSRSGRESVRKEGGRRETRRDESETPESRERDRSRAEGVGEGGGGDAVGYEAPPMINLEEEKDSVTLL
ncbi:unnamed protein product [Vitrella brassicaformis CCMP3155]|uniref:Peptidase M14 domain-containing protein n=2 Tax=Vitrella brassicaformis TaxID=1169539 RepID=A0A0G4EF70_VITBC|nr:unnamed protein product [Vitrella brassicaformis CCMP3155]|eukprot:CEL94616.1 unnamed protein product [Vitrella brassicaformis CCMP3155]